MLDLIYGNYSCDSFPTSEMISAPGVQWAHIVAIWWL